MVNVDGRWLMQDCGKEGVVGVVDDLVIQRLVGLRMVVRWTVWPIDGEAGGVCKTLYFRVR